jgi:hypothetical protein
METSFPFLGWKHRSPRISMFNSPEKTALTIRTGVILAKYAPAPGTRIANTLELDYP